MRSALFFIFLAVRKGERFNSYHEFTHGRGETMRYQPDYSHLVLTVCNAHVYVVGGLRWSRHVYMSRAVVSCVYICTYVL